MLFSFCFLLFALTANAQIERAAFTETGRGAVTAFVTDYQALGINPANLAFGNKYSRKFTLGFAPISFSLYAEGFTKENLWDGITSVDDKLSIDEKFQVANDFENTALSLDVSNTIFGFALNTAKAGNVAFGINFHGNQYSKFNVDGANHLWRGYVDPYFDQWVVLNENGIRDTIANQGPNSEELDNVLEGLSSNPRKGSDLYNGTTIKAVSYLEYSVG